MKETLLNLEKVIRILEEDEKKVKLEEELYEEQLRRDSECDWDEVDKLLNEMEKETTLMEKPVELTKERGGNNDVR